jgi:enamine deaminase RidA (YjgF/YER057c/UK114 family)
MSAEAPNRPGGLYRPAVLSSGPLLHLAGQTARNGEDMLATGVVGDDVDLLTAQACARQCVDNLMAHAGEALGGLERVNRVVRLNVFVAASRDFDGLSRVADAASARLAERLGERGSHARSAIGVFSLPRGSPVEIDATMELNE